MFNVWIQQTAMREHADICRVTIQRSFLSRLYAIGMPAKCMRMYQLHVSAAPEVLWYYQSLHYTGHGIEITARRQPPLCSMSKASLISSSL